MDLEKRNEMYNFLKDIFNIDLKGFDDDKIYLILNEVNSKMDQLINDELKKHEELMLELKNKQLELVQLVNDYK